MKGTKHVTKKELLEWLDNVLDDSITKLLIEVDGKVDTHFEYSPGFLFPIGRYTVSWDEITIKQLGGLKL